MKQGLRLGIAALSVIGLALGFGGLGPADAAEVNTVKLGVNMPYSGTASSWGIAYTNAFKLAVKQINAAGGFMVDGKKYNWEIVPCDSKYVTTEVVSCANKLIYGDKVKYMAVMGGAPSIAVAPITTKEKVLQICWAAGGKALTNPKFPLVFRHSPVDTTAAATGLYAWLKKNRGIKSVATIHVDNETGYSGGEGCKEGAKVNGLNLVGQEFYPIATTDFYPILSRVLAKKPDCIDTYMSLHGGVVLMAKQLYELKYTGVVVLYAADPEQSLKVAGSKALEGDYSYLTLAEMVTPEQKKFYNEYMAEYREWNEQALLAYDLPFTLTECIVEGKTFDPVKIAAIMENKPIPFLYGKGYYGMENVFGLKRQALFPTPFAQFKNGKWQHVTFLEAVVPK